jgi:mannosyl-3-phosphoglycerate phosphatase
MPLEQTNKDLWKWPLGLPYEHLVKGLREIRDELKWNIKGFSDMSIEEISSLTGLDRQTSRLAAMREYDEPFIILEKQSPDTSVLLNAAAKKGFVVTVGRRFYHLQGKNDKGQSMEKVISWYKQFHDNIVSTTILSRLLLGIVKTISQCLNVLITLFLSDQNPISKHQI